MPAIIKFHGYNPLPRHRRAAWARGWFAAVPRSVLRKASWRGGWTWMRAHLAPWERGKREPAGAFRLRVSRFLMAAEAAWAVITARSA
jgi:hypothetical protein